MNKMKSYLGVGALVLLLMSCGSRNKNEFEIIEPYQGTNEITVFGQVKNATESTVTLLTESGDSITFNTADADVEGVLAVGDNAEVVYEDTEENRKAASPSIDKVIASPAPDRLIGDWGEPSVMGDMSFQGIHLGENGAASSINQDLLTYKSWQLVKGKLVLESVTEGAGQPITSVDTFNIVRLTRDSLVLENINYTLVYTRMGRK